MQVARWAIFVAIAACLGLAEPSIAVHDPDLANPEVVCQVRASHHVALFLADKMGCLASCQKAAHKDPAMLSDCSPPYGGATFGCVQSAEGERWGKIQSACAKDCPECYSGGDCNADATIKIADAEARVEGLAPILFCDDWASSDGLTRGELRCQHSTARLLAKFEVKMMRCLENCRKAEHAGKIAAGSCGPPVTDEKTLECIGRIAERVIQRIDRRCEPPKAEKPECYGAETGASWVVLGTAQVDAADATFYCGE